LNLIETIIEIPLISKNNKIATVIIIFTVAQKSNSAERTLLHK
jgi:hypothetical protein